MADTTGKQTPPTDPEASGKTAGPSGPVKPPVLEGTARPAAGTPTGAKAGDSTSTTAGRTTKPQPADRQAGGSAWLAGLLGGAIGLGAAYGLAWFGLWPAPQPVPPPADPRLAQFASAIPELETVAATVQDELATLSARVGTLESAPAEGAGAAPDLAGLASSADLAALAARLDALAAAAGSQPAAGDVSQTLAGIEAEIAALKAGADQTSTQIASARQDIADLGRTAEDEAGSGLAAARLPLIFSSLDDAFATGRPFTAELGALRQALPGMTVPEAVAGAATDGLPRPAEVEARFAAALPDMLAGRPLDADAAWQDAAMDWFRGIVAMRPTGAVEGNSPDAIVARLEAAVAARDFATAQAELAALPRPMQAAAGPVADDMARLAAAQAFLAELRQAALATESGA